MVTALLLFGPCCITISHSSSALGEFEQQRHRVNLQLTFTLTWNGLVLAFCPDTICLVIGRCALTSDEKQSEELKDIEAQIKEKQHVFFDMEAYLPKKNG